jgi:hypothetical protein
MARSKNPIRPPSRPRRCPACGVEIFQRFIELEKRFVENRSAWFDRRKIFARDLAKQRTLLEASEEIE